MKNRPAMLEFHDTSRRVAIERPRLLADLRKALSRSHVVVLYPGSRRYPLAEGVEAVPVEALMNGTSIFSGRS